MVTNYPGAVNFQDPVTMEETLVVTGAITASGGITNPSFNQTIANIDAQNATPTIANILGGIVIHTSVTGAGTATVPTGTAMSAGISNVAVGSTVKWLYHNDGNQTVTITAATDHTLQGGTAAVTTGKYVNCTSVCTAAHVWVTYLSALL